MIRVEPLSLVAKVFIQIVIACVIILYVVRPNSVDTISEHCSKFNINNTITVAPGCSQLIEHWSTLMNTQHEFVKIDIDDDLSTTSLSHFVLTQPTPAQVASEETVPFSWIDVSEHVAFSWNKTFDWSSVATPDALPLRLQFEQRSSRWMSGDEHWFWGCIDIRFKHKEHTLRIHNDCRRHGCVCKSSFNTTTISPTSSQSIDKFSHPQLPHKRWSCTTMSHNMDMEVVQTNDKPLCGISDRKWHLRLIMSLQTLVACIVLCAIVYIWIQRRALFNMKWQQRADMRIEDHRIATTCIYDFLLPVMLLIIMSSLLLHFSETLQHAFTLWR